MVLRLTRQQARMVEDLLLAKKDEIEAGKWSQVNFAKWAGNRLHLPLTTGHLKPAMRAVDVKFVSHQGKGGSAYKSIRSEMSANKTAIAIVAQELYRLQQELYRLQLELDLPSSHDFKKTFYDDLCAVDPERCPEPEVFGDES